MELRQQLGILRHWFWFLVAGVLIGGGSAYLVSNSLPKVYEGKVTLIVGQSLSSANPDYTQLLASQRLSQTYATVATTRSILQGVIQRLALPIAPEDLSRRVSAQAPRESTLVTITASDGDPTTAARLANAVAEELVAASPALQGRQADVVQFVEDDLRATQLQIQSTQEEMDRLTGLPSRTADEEQQLQTLQGRVIALRSTYATLLSFSSDSSSNIVSVVEPASVPQNPSSPRVLVNTILAAALGLILAAGIAFLVEYLDDTVKTPEDIAEAASLPMLGAITRMEGGDKGGHPIAALRFPRSPAAEAFRTLRTNIEFASVDQAIRTMLVTSSIPQEGKTTTSANLAVAFAQAGRRVLLLDADLRRPGVHRMFDLPNSSGLTSLLRSPDQALDRFVQDVGIPGLTIMTTGPLPPNPAELLASERMKGILATLGAQVDLLIVDSPPLQAVTDAAILASRVDGTLLVIDAGRTRKGVVRQARATLEKSGAHVLGVSMNRLSSRMQGSYYYQYYGDYYGSGSEAVAPQAEKTPAQG